LAIKRFSKFILPKIKISKWSDLKVPRYQPNFLIPSKFEVSDTHLQPEYPGSELTIEITIDNDIKPLVVGNKCLKQTPNSWFCARTCMDVILGYLLKKLGKNYTIKTAGVLQIVEKINNAVNKSTTRFFIPKENIKIGGNEMDITSYIRNGKSIQKNINDIIDKIMIFDRFGEHVKNSRYTYALRCCDDINILENGSVEDYKDFTQDNNVSLLTFHFAIENGSMLNFKFRNLYFNNNKDKIAFQPLVESFQSTLYSKISLKNPYELKYTDIRTTIQDFGIFLLNCKLPMKTNKLINKPNNFDQILYCPADPGDRHDLIACAYRDNEIYVYNPSRKYPNLQKLYYNKLHLWKCIQRNDKFYQWESTGNFTNDNYFYVIQENYQKDDKFIPMVYIVDQAVKICKKPQKL
jgi:hypothetical protein